jgi:hypothetical protein
MSRISGKLNLLNLHGAVKMIPGKMGPVECVVIPLEKNKLFKGEKGIYLDLIAFEIAHDKRREGSKDTHLVKQSFSKEVRESMTEEQIKSLPILGSLQAWDESFTESEPVSSSTTLGEDDDLPF